MYIFTWNAVLRLWNNGVSPGYRHFITVSSEVSKQIALLAKSQPRKGRGSVRVTVRIGHYSRETSIFPDKKTACYLLPVKASVRKDLHIGVGDEVLVEICVEK